MIGQLPLDAVTVMAGVEPYRYRNQRHCHVQDIAHGLFPSASCPWSGMQCARRREARLTACGKAKLSRFCRTVHSGSTTMSSACKRVREWTRGRAQMHTRRASKSNYIMMLTVYTHGSARSAMACCSGRSGDARPSNSRQCRKPAPVRRADRPNRGAA